MNEYAKGIDLSLDFSDTTKKTLGNVVKEWKEANKGFVGKQLKDFGKSFTTMFTNKLATVGTDFAQSLKQLFKDSWTELNNMLKWSRLTNQEVRNQAFQYGFDPAQNYAFSKVSDLMGISGLEDIAYMNQQQRDKFFEKFNEYSDRYAQLYDSGFFDTLEQYNWEMEEFKQDLQYSIIQFFVDNKDVIKGVLKFLMSIMSGVAAIANFLIKPARTQEEKLADARRILGLTTSNTTNNNSNIRINNTFNGVSQQDRSWLQNAGTMTYEQFLRAQGG